MLVASFAIWGIGDIFYGSPTEETVVSVGSSEITGGELNDAFNRNLSNLQRQFGGQFTREQAIGLGLLQQTMQEQIGLRLVDLEATEMGISVDDNTLRRLITQDPAFQSAGSFDRVRFNQLLSRAGLSEEGYLASFRQEIARNTLTGSIAAAATVPDAQVDAIYNFRNEERRGRFLKIADADMENIPAPDDASLEAIYSENEEQFTAPEYRRITYVTIEPEDLLEEIEVSDDDIQVAYDDRSARYVSPERRSIEQLLVPDEETASTATSLIEEGKDFAAIAEELDGVSVTELGEITAAGMPAGIGTEAFAIGEGEVTDPVKSPFGFHLFKVNAITPEEVTPLADVRDELQREIALVEAEERLPSLATQLDDELAAGLAVPEAAGAVGLSANTVEAIDRQGRDRQDEPVPALEGWAQLLQTAFDAPLNEPSLLEETDDGAYYVIQIDEITEPALKPLDDVREDVVTIYEQQQRREAAKTLAEELHAKLQEAASFDTVAADAELTIVTIDPLKRSDDGTANSINRATIDALFMTDANEIADEVIDADDGVLILAVDEVIEKSPSEDAEAREQLKIELERQVQADLLDQFGRALQDIHAVSVDDGALDRLIEYDPAAHGYGGGGMAPGGPSPAMF